MTRQARAPVKITERLTRALADLVAGRPLSNTLMRELSKVGLATLRVTDVVEGHARRKIYAARPTAAGRSAHARAEAAARPLSVGPRPLPDSRVGADQRENWPRGWWASTGGLACVECPDRTPDVAVGEPIFLTGVSGQVLCRRHGELEDGGQ